MTSSGFQPVIRSIDSDMNVKCPSASVEKTTSGRVLDQEPVALLRLAQLALEAFLLGDVADGALDAGEPAVLPDRDRGDLGREGRPVAVLDAGSGSDGRRRARALLGSKFASASASDSSAVRSAKVRPATSAGVQPNSASEPSAMNRNRPSASQR